MNLKIIVLMEIIIFTVAAVADDNTPKKVVKALAIGNSFTLNATEYIKQLNKEDLKNELQVTLACIGGSSMATHVRLAELHDNNPDDIKGKPYRLHNGLKEMLKMEKWDIVTIQQVSYQSSDIKNYRPHAKALYDYIKKYCTGAEVVIHETWAYRCDYKGFNDKKTQLDMYRGLSNAYSTIAVELGNLRIIPVGDAFQNARQRQDFQYVPDKTFDFKNPVYPDLPNQKNSLCKGWFWKNDSGGKQALTLDGCHANAAGEFLGSLVWHEFFLGSDVRKNKFKPAEITEAEAAILREVAHATVADRLRPDANIKTVAKPIAQ